MNSIRAKAICRSDDSLIKLNKFAKLIRYIRLLKIVHLCVSLRRCGANYFEEGVISLSRMLLPFTSKDSCPSNPDYRCR